MEKYVLIDGNKFFYTEQELFHGRKTMDLRIAEENLKIFHSIIHGSGVRYGLMFGTLLGAIRENGFIPHDEDTDIYVLSEDKESFYKLLPELKSKGLEVIRESINIVSLMRNNEYIDVYFFELKRKINLSNYRVINNKFEIKARFLEKTELVFFLGMDICVPSQSEKVLEILYGKSWMIPIKDSFAQPKSYVKNFFKYFPIMQKLPVNAKIKEFIKKLLSYI